MMAFADSYWILVQFLSLLNIVVQVVAIVLSIVAVRGFRGAPINRVLKPLPVVFACMIVVNMPWASFYLFEVPSASAVYAVVFSVGVLAAVISAFQATMLLTERRDL
ncbi:hypothetical protein G9C85_02070 [Halorubellus sp. JP-L1]|uniref:hypothetical protein n=1 Tax=Halorubellus sp. JP-L1 TaxID=2715753 RepID=UPI001409CFAC|nr:hypothetical protein [Halorubellus sp. JP-L1]NHN40422.1 hypothetical protein [Halorubellus sp. JP-L1]